MRKEIDENEMKPANQTSSENPECVNGEAMSDDEKIDFVAARILREHIEAFKELAK